MEIQKETINKPIPPRESLPRWRKRIDFSYKKSLELDQTENIDRAANQFVYETCKNSYWNPEKYSFLWGTYLWDQASEAERVLLNQIYWVAYYSQIISAEIATIYFNQASAVSLYTLNDFRKVCDTLDLESGQERAHINAFSKISHKTEMEIFGKRIFSYDIRSPFEKTMLYSDLSELSQWVRKWQLKLYPMLASDSPYIGAQYFTVRALRTLNGKIIQDQLSKMVRMNKTSGDLPIPSLVSNYHFMDESFHFNTSMLLSKDIMVEIPKPTPIEKFIVNLSIKGCQKDHYHYSTALNGIFWYDPSLFETTYKMLCSKAFGMNKSEALYTLEKVFCEESQGMRNSEETHKTAIDSYRNYLSDFDDLWKINKDLGVMSQNTFENHLNNNKKIMKKFKRGLNGKH